jgi:putative ABC transport system permease protein
VSITHSVRAGAIRALGSVVVIGRAGGVVVVALLVGKVGVANITVISVLECRGETGLRPRRWERLTAALAPQFLAESVLLAPLGGLPTFAYSTSPLSFPAVR